jgi:hypothetical protein
MLIIDFDDCYIPQFYFLTSFRPSPKLPRHTCGPFASHHCEAAQRLKIADLQYVESNCMISDEWWIVKNFEWFLSSLIEVLSWCLLGRTEENHFEAQSWYPVSRRSTEPSISQIQM